MTAGGLLEAARRERGLTLEEAAAGTRVRRPHLAALEAWDFASMPAPVYARGYLKTYASFLGMDAAELLAAHAAGIGRNGRNLAFRPLAGLHAPSTLVLTAPIAAAVIAFLVVTALAGYVYRSLESVRVVTPTPGPAATALPTPPGPATAAGSTLVTPTSPPAPSRVSVLVTAMDTVWIDVQVDGKGQFGDAGKVLEAGASLSFSGFQKVRITSGKGALTQIAVNGKAPAALGSGVVSREFTPQS